MPADAAMTGTARLAKNDVFMLRIADLANRRIAFFVHLADFTRRQADLRITFVARHQSRRAAR